ncbi:AraC family transcriptional regulator [bacterium]|nr:MAG: AraC family transcriptional regulator [bacterium]
MEKWRILQTIARFVLPLHLIVRPMTCDKLGRYSRLIGRSCIMPTKYDSPITDMPTSLTELKGLIQKAVGGDNLRQPYESIWVSSSSCPTTPSHTMYMPLLCVVAQGSKQVTLGDEQYIYDTGHFLLNTVTLPATSRVLDASPEKPHLGMTIGLDPAMVGSVIAEAGLPTPTAGTPLRAMESSPIDCGLLDAVVRLARFFDSPRESPYLRSLVLREIIYLLLKGPQAARLHQIVPGLGQTQRVARAISWLRDNYDKPLTIEKLARESGMSSSALHHHFKDVTALTPLQFQKQLRLQEARRLMVSEGMDAANAGFKVGYDDPSYFSRDYRRFFGAPPRQHVERLRGDAVQIESAP